MNQNSPAINVQQEQGQKVSYISHILHHKQILNKDVTIILHLLNAAGDALEII